MLMVAIALTLAAVRLDAQTTVRSATPLLSAPNGRELAALRAGAEVRVAPGAAATRQGHTQVTLDGFIDASLIGSGRDSFPNAVKAPSGARLRRAGRSDAPIVANLRDGMGVNVMSRSGTWIRVRRTAWIATSALGAPAAAARAAGAGTGAARVAPERTMPPRPSPAERAAPTPSRQDTVAPPSTPQAGSALPLPGSLKPNGTIDLRAAPNGTVTARIDSGAVLVPLARDRGWVRVQVEGWIRDEEAVPADTALRLALSGADLRAAPEKYRGAMVRWDVEFIALQEADQLRRDLRSGERYILARGPGRESGLLYVAVPQALLAEAARLQALQVITITARIRVGRSEPAGVPVLDLLALARK